MRFAGGLSVPTGASYAVSGTTVFAGGVLDLGVAGSTGRLLGEGGGRSGAGTLTVTGIAGAPSQVTSATGFVGGNTVIADVAANDPDLVITATVDLASGGTLTLPGQTAWNSGGFTGNGGGLVSNAGTVSIATGAGASDFVKWENTGTVDYQGTDSLTFGQGTDGTFLNNGQVTVSTGQVDTGAYTQTGGATTVAGGAILGSSPALQGGVLTGTGTVIGNVDNSGGSVRPGASPGVLTIDGTYTQGSGGTLQTEIAGTTPGAQFDRLAVSGAVSLDGTLAIVNSFDPALSDTFGIITAGSRTGQFATLTGAQLSSGESYTPRYDPDGVTLLVEAAPNPPNTPPDTSITSALATAASGPGTTEDHTPTFTFVSTEPGSTFECSLDDGSFAACTTPFTTPSLPGGSHRFDVRAVDGLGAVDPTPATQTFQRRSGSLRLRLRLRLRHLS